MTRPQSRSFRNRLLLSFLIASLAPMIICSTMLSQISRIQMTKQLDTDAQTQTAHLMTALDRISDALPGAARALEESRLLPRAFTSREDTQINTALFLATEGSRDLADYSLYDLRGSLRYSTGSVTAGTALSTRWGVLFAAKNAGGQAVYQAPMDGGKTLLQGAALLKNPQGELLGYLVMELSEENFQKLFAGKYGSSNEVLILNRYWHPVYASQSGMKEELADSLRGQLLRNGNPGAETEEYRLLIQEHPPTGLYLVLRQPQMFTQSTMKLLHAASFFCVLMGIVISAVLCLPLSRRISQPIGRLLKAFSRVEQDDLDVHVSRDGEDELGQLASGFNHMVLALKANRQELVENQRELNQAQVRMLQAQLNPHFLCNTLDTMKWISKINHVPQVALMSTNLADILRFCISAEEFVPLRREVEVLNRYVEIQKIRLSDQFSFLVSLPEKLETCMVPKMILQPIVENAILHGLEGISDSVIRVEAAQEGEDLLITVTDNGHGLPPDMIGHPYRRESAPSGHHLGLFNVDTILKKHYGERYGLYLDNNPAGSGAAAPAPKGGRRMLKVLIVEDEELIRKGIALTVDWATLDCVVVGEAANGAEGLEKAEKCDPDLIITDLKMPQMDGIEMLERLRQAGKTTHVIILTAYDSFSYVQTALRLEAVDYLLKPFHDGDLEKAVQRVQAKLAPKQTVLPEPKTGSGNRYVSEAIQYIKNHYQEPDISVSSVAQSLNISEGHLSHTFRKETGSTLLGYLTRYRIHKAAELLKDCRVKVYEVAEQVGYRDIGYFSNTFKKITGKTPSEYQDSLSFRF